MTEERDPKVSRRYRELGAEEPPRELDQAILAAAHRAADRAHAPLVAPAGRHRWYFAFGAAAILVLAVAITVQVERQPDPEALPAASAPAAVPERKEGFSSEPGLVADQARARETPAQETRKKPAQAPAPAKPQPAENAARPQAAEVARADRLESRQNQSPSAEAQGTAGPAAATAPERRALASAVAITPEQLLERIAELRRQGKHEEADKALAEFRQRYPEYRISDEMLKKVERPK
jgi:hypothetical protein